MCVFNNELIISGYFTKIDGQPINHIAKWIGGNYTDSCQVVGIEVVSIDKQVSIFPSPTKDFIKIKSENFKLEVATISDLSGKIIFTKKISGTNETLDVSFLSPGLYFLYLQTSQGVCTKKFAKE